MPGYLICIVGIFVLPVVLLGRKQRAQLCSPAYALTIALVGLLGWGWSMLLSGKSWWSFNPELMLGIWVHEHLPLEELLFYPFGGALCVHLYLMGRDLGRGPAPRTLFFYLLAGTGAFSALVSAYHLRSPSYYGYSQLVLYNGICFALLPFVARHIRVSGVLFAVFVLSVIGFGWDYLGFTFEWWSYHAVTGVEVTIVPIEDFNFFLFAPPAAISIYVALERVFARAPAPA